MLDQLIQQMFGGGFLQGGKEQEQSQDQMPMPGAEFMGAPKQDSGSGDMIATVIKFLSGMGG